jgi:peptide deformylase
MVWDMVLTLLDQNDLRLRLACAPLSRSQLRDREQQYEIDALLSLVENSKADQDRTEIGAAIVGLSACQVSIMKQVCVVDMSIGRRGYHDFCVLVNPKITWRSKSVVTKSESCLNFPTVWGVTRRARSVRISALDRSGNDIEMKLEGWPAVLLQHEIDHMNGYLFIDRLADPTKAHLVDPGEHSQYLKRRGTWTKIIDVTGQTREPLDVT